MRYRKSHYFRHVYKAVHSQFSGKMIKEHILALRVSLNPHLRQIINYYIQTSHFMTSNLERRMLLKYQALYTFNMQLFQSGKINVFWNFSSQN